MRTEYHLSFGLLLRLILLAAVGPAVLMLAAGDARWTMGWIFSAFSFSYTLFSRLVILRRSPSLIAERAGSLKKANVEPWDRVLVPILGILLPLAMVIVAGLDRRFGWTSDFPLWLQSAVYLPMFLGASFALLAALENAYFSAVVRIQEDRGQTVVTTGPYRIVRHPGYAGGLLYNLSLPFALGSPWACIPGGVLVILTIVRTALEDVTLMRKLPGYPEYAARVKSRLIPGVW